ncbi:hypothetical protein H8356DRAFT_1701540 [Neocallimastix lanati (nom. inval.)]|jgi:26 proteasome complex subunit DSS1|uniref:26S proteasome complex subunit SEM1 n=1 Tax=Neocallimastix californiae TaxID=1754190 RepID=A0A1Y2AD51_9FUNG|nr:hypothetical protein H8356DRAFT_1701540 [Neocallimastix sp. JGI-2020a]ORY20220.1 hypothetical protein LY90DRAFT_707957 [Neocallimastix californiae]|eukprot:ORY20220.1 hypothetical protein LY90DRAFT_707957 [Neocallimastix californiae]
MPEPQEKNTSTPQKDEKTVEKKVNVLEDDDEFEDFPADEWEDVKVEHQWQDTWEDDVNEDDFYTQLMNETEKITGVQPMKL